MKLHEQIVSVLGVSDAPFSEQILVLTAVSALAALAVNSMIIMYYVITDISVVPRRTRREALSVVPRIFRLLGYWFMGVFLACLLFAAVLDMLQ